MSHIIIDVLKNMKELDSIIPISAYAEGVVEHGRVGCIIDGYLMHFTIMQYSNGITNILLDNDNKKYREILSKYGVTFNKNTQDKIFGDDFIDYLNGIYSKSNSHGGPGCHWVTDNFSDLEYEEIE